MNRDKQIEEMAKVINTTSVIQCMGGCTECEYFKMCNEDYCCVDFAISKSLTEKGYRKASDVAREILALVWDAYQTTHYDAEFEERLDNIEKKYEREEIK